MSSPIPPDPYAALGVAKDADLSAIRSAHRKLVLKHHPDRIKDEALKEKGKNEFQKIQQAYEIISDPVKRERYDDKVKLAELRREAMMREPPPARREPYTASYPIRTAPPSKPSPREYRDDGIYEERSPAAASTSRYDNKYGSSDNKDRFEDPLRTSSRKHPEYERKPSVSKPSLEKTAKVTAASLAGLASAYTTLKKSSDRAREKVREREAQASKQETRDREKRRDRNEKQSRRSYVADATDSDSDTATRVTTSTVKPSKPSPQSKKESEPVGHRHSGSSRRTDHAEDDSDHYDKWESHHDKSKAYIEKASKRPVLNRTGSDAVDYWNSSKPRTDRDYDRRSGSDSERKPTPSKGRRTYDEPPPRPSMPTYSSAPSNLKAHVEERIPSSQRRTASGIYPERPRDPRREMPSFSRSQTMPSPRPTPKKENAAPAKGSNLKHGETHDSGYGSSSSPQTPEMREDSPVRNSKTKQTTTKKYQIVDPATDAEDDYRRPRVTQILPEEDRSRRFQSPEGDRRESDRDRERRKEWGERERSDRPRPEVGSRSRTSRDIPTREDMPPMRRTESSRYDPRSGRQSPPPSRNGSARDKLYGEFSGDERDPSGYRRPYPEKVSAARYSEPKYANYQRDTPEQRDYAHGSRFQSSIRHPEAAPRRPSVY